MLQLKPTQGALDFGENCKGVQRVVTAETKKLSFAEMHAKMLWYEGEVSSSSSSSSSSKSSNNNCSDRDQQTAEQQQIAATAAESRERNAAESGCCSRVLSKAGERTNRCVWWVDRSKSCGTKWRPYEEASMTKNWKLCSSNTRSRWKSPLLTMRTSWQSNHACTLIKCR